MDTILALYREEIMPSFHSLHFHHTCLAFHSEYYGVLCGCVLERGGGEVSWTMPRTTTELLKCWYLKVLGKDKEKIWNTMPVLLCRIIWKEGTLGFLRAKRNLLSAFRTDAVLYCFIGVRWKMLMM